MGYQKVRLGPIERKPGFVLRVERVQQHTAASLHALDQEFYSLADKYGVASYDGMDVSPVLTAASAASAAK